MMVEYGTIDRNLIVEIVLPRVDDFDEAVVRVRELVATILEDVEMTVAVYPGSKLGVRVLFERLKGQEDSCTILVNDEITAMLLTRRIGLMIDEDAG